MIPRACSACGLILEVGMGFRRIPLIDGGAVYLCREDNDRCDGPHEDWRAVFDAELRADVEAEIAAANAPPKPTRAVSDKPRREGLRAGVVKGLSAGNRFIPKPEETEQTGDDSGDVFSGQ